MKRYFGLSVFLVAMAAAATLFSAGYSYWFATAATAGGDEGYLVVLDALDGFAEKADTLGFTKIETLNIPELGTAAHRVTVPGGARLKAQLRKLRQAFPDAIIVESDS